MRELTSHKVNGLNEAIRILVLDEPGSGNACHEYRLEYPVISTEEMKLAGCSEVSNLIRFQNGPIQEHGVNGISNEALLAIVEDRLDCFQAGEFSCYENQVALEHVRTAMQWLHVRTRDRVARGVEGTMQK